MKKCQPRSLTPYLDGELAADANQQVDEHLQGCPSCAALLDEVTSARERLGRMGRAIVPNTVLMPALEAFRERAGIGSTQQLSLADIPVPARAAEAEPLPPVEDTRAEAIEAPPVADGYAPPAFPPLPDSPFADNYADAYTAAVVENPQAEAERVAAAEAAAEAERIAAAEAAAEAERIAAAEAALEARPEAPHPPVAPPWLEAEAADAEDMEARGRLFVAEDLAPPMPAPPVPAAPQHSEVGVAEAVARMREELHEDTAPAPDARSDAASGYRDAIRARRERERPSGIGGLDRQVKVGLGAAAAILLLLIVVASAPRLFSRPASHAAARPVPAASAPAVAGAPSTAPSVAPAVGPSVAPSAAPSPAASTAPLSNVVTAGGTGSAYRAIRIRTGNPASGVSRIVFDLDGGSGTLPDAQLGRAADGSLYLQSAGLSVDPGVLATFGGVGPVSAITSTGSSTNLKFATSGQPQYSLYFLTGPNRLVLDLK